MEIERNHTDAPHASQAEWIGTVRGIMENNGNDVGDSGGVFRLPAWLCDRIRCADKHEEI